MRMPENTIGESTNRRQADHRKENHAAESDPSLGLTSGCSRQVFSTSENDQITDDVDERGKEECLANPAMPYVELVQGIVE